MGDLSKAAIIYITGLSLAGALALFGQLAVLDWMPWELWLLAMVAAVAHVKKVDGPTPRSTYNLAWMIYGITFFLLGAPATAFIMLVSHLAEWIYHRIPWYIQIFNIGSYALVALFAWGANQAVHWIIPVEHLAAALGLILAYLTFTLMNHLLVGVVIWLARGQNFRQSGVFGLSTLMIDFTLIGLGGATGILWVYNPLASVLTIIPVYLIYLTLQLPALQRKTEIDAKTNLFNARYFRETLEKEFARAQRFERPLTVVMGDLDYLREINNTYGHLAGDVVLDGIARMLQDNFCGLEVVARFGGEEFAVILPETSPEKAVERVQAVRAAFAETPFQVETSVMPINASMSFGIAGLEDGITTSDDLIHNADVALYHAKFSGRNRVCVYSEQGVQELFGALGNHQEQDIMQPEYASLLGVFLPVREIRSGEGTTPIEKSIPEMDSKPEAKPDLKVTLYS